MLQTPRLSVLYVIILGVSLAHCGSGYFDWRTTRKSDPHGANAVTAPAGNSAAFQNAVACGASYSPGHAALHLLSTEEYNRTIADLLFTSSKASDLAIFEAAPKGTTGFATDTGNFALTDLTINKYWNAATALADELLRSKGQGGAYAQIAGCAIGQTPVPQSCYQKVVLSLGQRAWRRPIAAGSDGDESSRLLAIMSAAGSFDDGLKALIQALLISPNFLFVSVTSPQSTTAGAAFTLDQFQLASRLSYYLWGSMPDSELFSAAADGKLAEQLAAAQAQLFAEKQRRADAECEAQVNGGGGRRRWTADGGGVWDAASDHTVSNGQYRPDVPALPLIPCPPAARVRPPTNTPRLAPAGAQGAR